MIKCLKTNSISMTILVLLLYTYILKNSNAIIDKLLVKLGLDLSNLLI